MAHNTKVGKDILEMLMFSLYPEAETIYREYLQNACDSINEAVESGLLTTREDGHVTIKIDPYHNKIIITDNGTGIPAAEAEARLKDIASGNKKRKESAAGFYGIGRLVGAGYCKQLSFKTSANGEDIASEMVFDVERIREILNDDENESSASEVIDAVTTLSTQPESADNHYFVVTLTDILPEYPELLDENLIYKYLCQVAPIPYSSVFKNNLITRDLTDDNAVYLDYYNQLNAIQVTINDNVNIRKKYGLTIDGTGDEIAKLRFFTLDDPQFGVLAWGWYAITPFEKAIPDTDPETNKPVLTRGIRLRVHNIQIGNENYFDGTSYFRQARSNKYFNGEIHVIHPKIKPTTDRSDLAPTKEAIKLIELIKDIFNSELQKVYQTANKVKNDLKKVEEANSELVSIKKTETSDSFTQEEKNKKIIELEKQKKEAEENFKKHFSSTETKKTNKGMIDVFDIYRKKEVEIQNDFKQEKTKPFISTQNKNHSKTKAMEKEIDSLVPSYGADKIDMLKTVFYIIDSQFKDSNPTYMSAIKSIKTIVIKRLKEK